MEIALGAVVCIGLLILYFVFKQKRNAATALREKGALVGEWTVYYDVPNQRVGLKASFGEEYLLRYLVFRLHDLFHYNVGLRAQQQEIIGAVGAAIRGQGASWQFVFPPAQQEIFHAHDTPDGTFYKYFNGSLFEGAISQPRFMGGDSIAKQAGLLGECVALAGHLAQTQPDAGAAVEALIRAQEQQGDERPGHFFWRRARTALNAA